MTPRVILDWSDRRSLIVSQEDDAVHVVAHPELSEAQVAAACAAIGPSGDLILKAWRQVVGLTTAR